MAQFSNQGNGIDNFIRQQAATTNYGQQPIFDIGEEYGGSNTLSRTLIKWDLSSIPAGAVVTSAVLTIYVNTDSSNNTRTLRAYRVLRNWTEDGSTWNTYDGSNNWGTAGCANTSTDREASDIGNVSLPNNLSAGTAVNVTLTNASVQEWISGAMANYGVLLKMDTESDDQYRYDSTQHGTANLRPKLVIDYNLPSITGAQSITGIQSITL